MIWIYSVAYAIMVGAMCMGSFYLGKKIGWHSACSECLSGFASAMRTMEEACHCWEGKDYTGAHPVPMGLINSLAGEYKEELKARGIWREGT